MNHEFLSDANYSSAPGGLEWLADTDGKFFYGAYNIVDIYHMRRLGFHVQVSTRFRPIVWEQWSTVLGSVFNNVYIMKAQAKRAGDPKLELFCKIILNSSIGKFAQRMTPDSNFDGKTYTKGSVTSNKTLFQLNSFCMSYSRLINQGHQSLICKGTHIPDYIWTTKKECFLNNPIYGDTDNLIFQVSSLETLAETMKNDNLLPSTTLCTWNDAFSYFNMTLEFEDWHADEEGKGYKCPNLPFPNAPIRSTAIFLGKKSYIMACQYCGAMRLKAKGHAKSGIKVKDFAKLFVPGAYSRDHLLPTGECMDAASTTLRMFKTIYPHFSDEQCANITSGKRFTFKISLAKNGVISIAPSHIERAYRACISVNQTRCENCLFIIHE